MKIRKKGRKRTMNLYVGSGRSKNLVYKKKVKEPNGITH